MDDESYVQRLEKIIDKQDALLSQFDAKFNQQDTLNEYLSKHNNLLIEDVQKHKNLLRDMKKTVTQHKNVVAKLKGELEEQLRIQQDLHKDYGEIIKQLTDDLEAEQKKTEELQSKNDELEKQLSEAKTKQIPTYNDAFTNPSHDDIKTKATIAPAREVNRCPKCGAKVEDGYMFCESCGNKLK